MLIKSSRIFVFMLLMCFIASISGVFGIWIFSEEPPQPQEESFGPSLSEFTWQPEEILPSDKIGENYLVLFESILNNMKGGLNSSKGTLENAVLAHKLVHSSDKVEGGNLKHLFTTEESKDLDFLVEYVSDNEFNAYMYETYDTINGLIDTTKIMVYKTIFKQENGQWFGEESQLGYATLRYYKETNKIAILPSEWIKGNLPTQSLN